MVELDDLDVSDWTLSHYHCLGYYIGDQIPGFKPVAVNGLPPNLPFDFARALVISMPTSGSVTLAHIVGTTPEAPTLEAALGGKEPECVIRVSKREMTRTWERLNVWDDDRVEHVAFGCPHSTIDEIGRIANLVEGEENQDHDVDRCFRAGTGAGSSAGLGRNHRKGRRAFRAGLPLDYQSLYTSGYRGR